MRRHVAGGFSRAFRPLTTRSILHCQEKLTAGRFNTSNVASRHRRCGSHGGSAVITISEDGGHSQAVAPKATK
jgi:hypothetical protein